MTGLDKSLSEKLRQRILATGPVTFSEWMAAALYDPDHGYYCTAERTRWGREGDYRTSPERSVLFAATFARYFARLYEELGAPSEWTIVEAGAGAGDFAAGLLKTFRRRFPSLYHATQYVIDERSSSSRDLARSRLKSFGARVEFAELSDLVSINAGVIFANELLDAFPVHRVSRREGRLLEFYVGVDSTGDFEWRLQAPSTERLTKYFQRSGVSLAEGQIAEVNLGIEDWLLMVAPRLHRGYLVLVDYGAEAAELYQSSARHQGTLRSFHRHQFRENLLAQPGQYDLTTTVDWTSVIGLGVELGFRVVGFERQDKFLREAGILEELELATDELDDDGARLTLRTDAREMILPGGMAESFQVLVLRK